MAYRMPNGYGSVVKLGGRRRKPYAVRVTTSFELVGEGDDLHAVQKYKYLEYFEKRTDAIKFLASYNSGMRVREHRSIEDMPTFAEVFEHVIEEKEKSKKGLKTNLRRSYKAAFQKFEDIHDMKICNVRYVDVQGIVDRCSAMSKSSVNNMIMVCHAIGAYAKKYEYILTDFSEHLTGEFEGEKGIHKPFTSEEISILRNDVCEDAALFALITIYTGMRPSELIGLAFTEEDLSRHYLTAGSKTAAGRNRVIPLHPDIEALIAERTIESGNPVIFPKMSLSLFRKRVWDPYMQTVDMEHLPHDGRHSCATLMEAAGISLGRRKLILGHSNRDVTEGVYTHVAPEELVAEISKISP